MDIFSSAVRLPESVVILCPGPGAAGWVRGDDDYIIACNAAVWHSVNPDWWIASDENAVGKDWFRPAAAEGIETLFGEGLAAKVGYYTGYTYRRGLPFGSGHGYKPLPSALRPNGTILGEALQFAWWFGALDVSIVGADMRGDKYWTGESVPEYKRRDIWPYVQTLNNLIAVLRESGMTVTALTETELSC